MNNHIPLLLWGKTCDQDPAQYHPLVFHLMDVGAVARALWRQVISSSVKHAISEGLGLDNQALAEQVTVLLCAQHDLGKATAFQCKSPELWVAVQSIGAGQNPNLGGNSKAPHAMLTSLLLPGLVTKGDTSLVGWTAAPRTAKALARIIGGHHGAFPCSDDLARPFSIDTKGGPAWDEVRCDILAIVAKGLYPTDVAVSVPLDRLTDSCLVPLIGGLTTVADWIGSNQAFFPPSSELGLDEYVSKLDQRAESALFQLGWMPRPTFASPVEFGQVFTTQAGSPFTPNSLQTTVIDQVSKQSDPYLLIIEAAMGDGKTEAALFAVDCAIGAGFACGLYMALPTQATGNAMFNRVLSDYLMPRGHTNLEVHLVHGGSFLSEVYDELQLASMGDDTSGEEVMSASTWFVNKKRALLAPIGVGTIDQALLSVLQTKHWFVRLFGLAGKVVVFDEVHAYDVYMGTILERLLAWLKSLGCTVVLLSATLPSKTRKSLLDAWGASQAEEEAQYPRVTFANKSIVKAVEVKSESDRHTRIHMATCGIEPYAMCDALLKGLPESGCATVICNTVGRSQAVYQELKERASPFGWEVLLTHARMPHIWRTRRDQSVLDRFGKNVNTRPGRTVIVGTQVLEQSLDYDVDWMASDMAPVDLLLQRMGRLWRHPRTDRPVDHPQFVIACGVGENGLPRFPNGSEWVYERYILLRTYLAIAAKVRLDIPADIEPLVEWVYGDDSLDAFSDPWHEALSQALENHRLTQQEYRSIAESVLVPSPTLGLDEVLNPGSTLNSQRRLLYDDDDPSLHQSVRAATRLGLPSISIVCTGTLADGTPLAPESGREPTSKGEVRSLLNWSLNLSHPGLFRHLIAQQVPVAWTKNRHLRFHREVRFENGECEVGEYRLSLTEEMGLMIEKRGENDPK